MEATGLTWGGIFPEVYQLTATRLIVLTVRDGFITGASDFRETRQWEVRARRVWQAATD